VGSSRKAGLSFTFLSSLSILARLNSFKKSTTLRTVSSDILAWLAISL